MICYNAEESKFDIFFICAVKYLDSDLNKRDTAESDSSYPDSSPEGFGLSYFHKKRLPKNNGIINDRLPKQYLIYYNIICEKNKEFLGKKAVPRQQQER